MLVTLIAAVHYLFMHEYWVTIKQIPILYGHIDCSLTRPLQMNEFFCFFRAVKTVLVAGLSWRLLLCTVVTFDFRYLCVHCIVNPWSGFAIRNAKWGFI